MTVCHLRHVPLLFALTVGLGFPLRAQVTLHSAAEKAAHESTPSARPAPPAARTAAPFGALAAGDVLVPRDGSFTLALGPNDDGSTSAIPLPFSFDLYGTTYDEVYINNNGNVTFEGPLGTFTPFAFPSDLPIVAPFFADVDTRGAGAVYYKSEPGRFTVLWEAVGYYNRQTDKLNTFELVLTDGTDPLTGAGNNVCLSYGDMNWTTGSFSGGSNGFGGTAAIAGANAGDDASFFTIGRFDRSGDAYDGPGGTNDGVDYLDDRDVCLSTSDSATNVPPIAQGVSDGQVFDIAYNPMSQTISGTIDFSFLSPETGQTTEITSPQFDSSGYYDGPEFLYADVTFTTTAGNPATGQVEVLLAPAIGALGGDEFDIDLVACDDGPDGGECTEITITVRLDSFPTRECEPGAWYVFGFDADGDGVGTLASGFSDGEYVLVYASGPGPLDLSGCDFVAFDPFTERVVFTADLDGVVLGPFADTVVLEGGVDFPEGSIPDGPGAIAFVQGEVEVGDSVPSVLGRVAYALVYFDDENLFGVFPADSPGARVAGRAGDLEAQLAAFREEAGESGPTLAVSPNPVRSGGSITFQLDAEADVRIAAYDVLGREVAVLVQGTYPAGPHLATFDASALPAGAYFVRLNTGRAEHMTRVTVVR